jgi:hypothetical protein
MSGTAQPTLAKCLADAVAAGRLTAAAAADAQQRLAARMQVLGANPSAAAVQVAEEMALAAAVHQRQTALRIIATARVTQQAQGHASGTAMGVAALFARDVTGKAGYSSVEGRARAVLGELHARFADGLDMFRSKNLGLTRDLPGLRQFVAELYGQGTGNAAAAQAAKAWTATTEYALRRFNAAGGNITELDTWRLPQAWNAEAVRGAGRDRFVSLMEAAADRGDLLIRDFATGKPMAPVPRRQLIEQTYARIESEGLVDLVPGQISGSPAVANSRNQARVFQWTSANAWLDFNDRFGNGDAGIFDLLTGHLQGMARDVGMLEVLGPNPHHLARYLIDLARKDGAPAYQANKLAAIWDHVSGAANSPVSQWLASSMAGIRGWLSAAQLGSAVLSSVTDFATLKATAAWNGIPAVDVMRRYAGLLNPANPRDRLTAVRLGLIADGWAQRAAAAQRNQMDAVTGGWGGRAADFVLRVSGMNAHTQAGKWAFGMEFLAHLADRAGRDFAALEPALRQSMTRYGVTAGDWDLIRQHGVWRDPSGVAFIHPEQIVTSAPAGAPQAPGAMGVLDSFSAEQRARVAAASRLMEMVQTEGGFAIVEPGALERAITLGRTRPGTGTGEFLRASMQYKSFPVSMMTRHLARGLLAYQGGDHGRYLAATAIGLTVMGAFAMQMKAVTQGKDPRDMTDWRFWGAAWFQGGGAGIFGDFLFAGLNRADRGFYMAMLGGPTAGLVDDVARLTGGNIQGLAEDKDTNFGAELARFVQRNTPGTSLWYARLALDRMLWDRLQDMADPNAARRWRRMEDRARRDFDQEFWWGPGRAPDRGPSIGAAIGAER